MKIIVDNVWSYLVYEEGDRKISKELDDALSVWKKGYYFTTSYRRGLWDGKIHFFKITTQTFPTGLLSTVKKFLNKNLIDYEIIDKTTKVSFDIAEVKEDMLKDIVLRDYQVEAIKKALEKQRGIIFAATNSGKTEIAAAIMKVVKEPALYFVHRRDLLIQTADRIEARLNERVDRIWGSERESKNRIKVLTIQSAYIGRRSDLISKMLDEAKIIFLDECHVLASTEWVKVTYDCPAPLRFGLSGTPFTDDEVKNMSLVAVTGGVICEIRNISLIEKGYSAKPVVYFHYVALGDGAGDYYTDYNAFIVRGLKRNKKICELAKQKLEEDKSTMILVKMIEHGYFLQQLFKHEYDLDVPFIFGGEDLDYRTNIIKDFKENKIKLVIASTIADEGLDISSLKCLIVAAGGKSKVKVLQRIGRALRKKMDENVVEIHDFIDDDRRILYEHSRRRKRICKSEGFEVEVVEVEEGPKTENTYSTFFSQS